MPMNAILVYCHRDLLRWIRAKWGFIAATTIPVAWLIFVGLTSPSVLLIIISIL